MGIPRNLELGFGLGRCSVWSTILFFTFFESVLSFTFTVAPVYNASPFGTSRVVLQDAITTMMMVIIK
jgi:hypothetical protein